MGLVHSTRIPLQWRATGKADVVVAVAAMEVALKVGLGSRVAGR